MSDDASSRSRGQSLWGGRFERKPAELMQAINVSIGFDRRLAAQDLAGSRAHAAMLSKQGVISSEDATAIQSGLDAIEAEMRAGTFPFRDEYEDIHMNVEARLAELIGPAAGRLHTARSRNDQVAVDFRLWVKAACERTVAQVETLQGALLAKAEAHAETLMPGFTHLQPAQPVTFGHHLMAYVEMFGRDASRFRDALARMNESPLGAAALAGSPYAIDRFATAASLGFERPTANSLDSVSDRDFALEALSAASIASVHLSRLAEEIVIWTTPQFGFISLTDAFTTGSSIMPQKRNPDAAELIRAKVGRVLGSLTQLTVVMKGLPLAYSKDMQEDKPPVFEAFDALDLSLSAMAGMVDDLQPNVARMAEAAGAGFSTATDLADWLVRALGLPFRQAHHITGQVVKRAEQLGVGLSDMPLQELQGIEPRVTAEVFGVLTPEASVASRTSYGGTAPVRVREQIGRWKALLQKETLGMSRWILDGRRVAVALLAVSAAALSACGKRGVLDTPPPLFGDRAKARYEASQQQAQDAADARARTGNTTSAADQSDDGPRTTRDIKAPEQLLTPASQAPIVGAPDPRGPAANPNPPG